MPRREWKSERRITIQTGPAVTLSWFNYGVATQNITRSVLIEPLVQAKRTSVNIPERALQ